MTDLLTRLEQATEGSRELDDAISAAIGKPPPKTGGYYGWEGGPGSYSKPKDSEGRTFDTWASKHYTISLDAKLPWENIVAISRSHFKNHVRWNAIHEAEDGGMFTGQGHTEPLARRIAALRARG